MASPGTQGVGETGAIPPPPGVTPDFDSPVYHSGGIIPISAIFITLSTVFLAIRIYTKTHLIKIFGLEDYTIVAAYIFNIGLCIICLVQQKYGNGIHIWNITAEHFQIYTKWAAAAPIVYCPAVALAKVAILLFYLRLNPNKSFRYSIYFVLFLTIGYMTAICLALFFQCKPIAKFWDPFLEGTCLHSADLYLWNSILNVVTDFLVLLVPIPMLRALQVGKKQKWGLGLLFAIGSLTCILSAVRTYYVSSLLHVPLDSSWNVPTSTSLIVVESNLSIVCGCIMVLRPFFRRHMPWLMGGTTAGRSGPIYDGYVRSNDVKNSVKISSSGNKKSRGRQSGSHMGSAMRSWVGQDRRGTTDTDDTAVDKDIELGERPKVGWPLESGRGLGGLGRGRRDGEPRSESEENIIEESMMRDAGMGIVKTTRVDVR